MKACAGGPPPPRYSPIARGVVVEELGLADVAHQGVEADVPRLRHDPDVNPLCALAGEDLPAIQGGSGARGRPQFSPRGHATA